MGQIDLSQKVLNRYVNYLENVSLTANLQSGWQFRKMSKKYSDYGTSLNRNSGHSGRPKTGRSQENINRVHELLVEILIGYTNYLSIY